MAEEIKSIFKSRNYWMAFVISFLTLLGYSLSSWLNAISVGESMEYRESALSLSVGGIFFGGFMLLFPFCASVAHATSQVDELRSGMARWRVMRGSVARYVGVKAAASMLAAALATTSAFALHAVIWNGIALPCDPAAYAVHTIYFSEDCVYADLYTVCYGLPMYAAVAAGMAFSAAVWAVTALATAAWSPDKLMAFTIPSFIYYLWSADAAEWFLGLNIPHPASLFNDGLSPERLCAALASYGVLFAVSLAAYCAGCERRLRHA